MTDDSKASPGSGLSGGGHEVPMTADMIASNVNPSDRVAPSLSKISVIDDLYDFADRLRAGSTLGGKPRE
jgi:hypothetical protein